MSEYSSLGFEYINSEVVLGLVYAVGTDSRRVRDALDDHLKKFKYKLNPIQISDYLSNLNLKIELPIEPEADRIDSRMKAGNRARQEAKRDDFLALAAVSQVAQNRKVFKEKNTPKPQPRTAHVLFSLKRPEEVLTLRRIYGPGFYLIGVFASEKERLNFLEKDKNIPHKRSLELVARDQEEKDDHGQMTRQTFELADVFIRLHADDFKDQLWRFLNLIFGHPFETPSQDENAMFLAYAASLRSASLARQVGASIIIESGELVAIGCNEVPCAGGGLYWPGRVDHRDHKQGYDSNDLRRNEIICDTVKRLRPEIRDKKAIQEARPLLRGSPLEEITEYGRSVHAEMEALLSCARAGISPRGGTLYATTFPCHNCARHIIAAGINRVVYIEPYPKSYAEKLHFDAIDIDPGGKGKNRKPTKVIFESFVGVGPRRYLDLFSTKLSTGYPIERKENGKPVKWEPSKAALRVPIFPVSYLQREQLAIAKIAQKMKKLKEK